MELLRQWPRELVAPVGAVDWVADEALHLELARAEARDLVDQALHLELARAEARYLVDQALHLELVRAEARDPALQRWARRTKPVSGAKRM